MFFAAFTSGSWTVPQPQARSRTSRVVSWCGWSRRRSVMRVRILVPLSRAPARFAVFFHAVSMADVALSLTRFHRSAHAWAWVESAGLQTSHAHPDVRDDSAACMDPKPAHHLVAICHPIGDHRRSA